MPTAALSRDDFGQQLFDGLQALPSSSRLTPEQLEVIYALAYTHVVQKQYAQALPVFSFLSQYGPTRKHYLSGLGLCLHMVGRHEEAINIYSVVILLFPDSFDAALHVAEAQIALEQFDDALVSLRRVAESDQAPAELRTRAATLVGMIGKGLTQTA